MDYLSQKKARFYMLSFIRYDLKASITVFFVALPLCLGISLASGTPVYSGLLSGIIGGILISFLSGSELSVSGPAAGLTAICSAAIIKLGSIELFYFSVAIAGLIQALLGLFRLGGFTHFIPSAVIKGMLAAIGIILISKQIPALIGYDKPEFWSNELFNILTLNHVFSNVKSLYNNTTAGAITISFLSILLLIAWDRWLATRIKFLPVSFIIVLFGALLAFAFKAFIPSLQLKATEFVNLPHHIFRQIKFGNFHNIFSKAEIWENAIVICVVASLETLLSVEAIDKLDPYNRVTPQNRELIAQGSGNFLSGLLGGLPITAVIVRSSANAEAGARTRLSAFTHGIWLLLTVLFAVSIINLIPYCALGVILVRTGFNLAKPKMIRGIYRQGREQFLPFMITVLSILFTDLLIGVGIGLIYSIYFIIKHTYLAGYTLTKTKDGSIEHYKINLALNVSFLNKKRILEVLDRIPEYSMVTIDGKNSVYIDYDLLEIFKDFTSKAHNKHIQLTMTGIPDVQTIELH